MRTELEQILIEGMTDAGTDDGRNCNCGWSSRRGFSYMRQLQKEKLWPVQMLDTTISQVVERMEVMNDPALPQEWVRCDYRWHTDPNYRATRSWRLRTFKKSNGLCIDCIRSSNVTAVATQSCRIRHQHCLARSVRDRETWLDARMLWRSYPKQQLFPSVDPYLSIIQSVWNY